MVETSASAGVSALHAPDDAALRHSRRVVETLFGPPAARAFAVRYWDGTVERGQRTPTPFTFVIARPGALRAMLLPPSELSIVEAYLSGDVDIEGDLSAAVTMSDAINRSVRSPRALAALARDLIALPRHDSNAATARRARSKRTVRGRGHRHEPARDRAAIHYHYDVGNDFYQLFLDERMVYSCAYFAEPSYTLDEAQRAKLDLVCRKLRLEPGERLLDVGCGWGALIMHAAREYGVTAVGITLSEQQRALASQRIAEAGLGDRCRVEIRDYRDLAPLGAFDKASSIGMVEHVGVDHLPAYFASVAAALAPGGLFLNHGIVSIEAALPLTWRQRLERKLWRRDAFIDQYVFPDGKLGPFHAVVRAAEAAGFETRDVESLREHYALTLEQWVARLRRNQEAVTALVGDTTYRVWRLYMTASSRAFAAAQLNVVQTLLSKPDAGRASLPMTRRDLYVI